MSEREHIVSLNKGVDYEGFNADMIRDTGAGDIPNRTVSVLNARPGSARNTHYDLTDAEAEALRSDSRVYGVTLLPELDTNLHIGFDATQTGDFSKTLLDRGSFLNWGMRRCNEAENVYTGAVAAAGGYGYTLDGTGVDVVIMDSGIQADHPEFQDASGVSRVQQINWATESGLGFTQNANHYRDYDGHGTHVAGTATGKTYGWAKNAKIYSVKLAGLEGTGDSGTGISITYAFDCIKLWHNAKTVDAATGYKRPTIVNMSWGYGIGYDTVSGMVYRGSAKSGTDIDSASKRAAFGLYPASGASMGRTYASNARVASVDVDMQELIDAGVHVMVAAGNRSHKIDVASGLDYDNTTTSSSGTIYHNRGSSPYDDQANTVGSIDTAVNPGGLEQKATYSETGPAVTIYAPGTDIMSAMSTTNKFGANTTNNPYPANSAYLINNISGTSMASPQVAGMAALNAQLNPASTPAQLKAFIESTAKTAQLYDTASVVDYDNNRSLSGSSNRFLYNKFNSNTQLTIGTPAAAVSYAAAATYSLSRSGAAFNEGQSFTITLTTANIADATNVPYTITGVTTADISGASLTGNFTIASNTASAIFTLANDALTEGAETFTITLNGVSESITVAINDTSITPTYALSGSAANVNEGSTLTVTLNTANLADATTVPYTITGINSADIGGASLAGIFTIASNTANAAFAITADETTEGAETMVLTLDSLGVNLSTTLNDTSLTPGATHVLTRSATTISEGQSVTLTLSTTNVADATTVPYTLSGVTSADLDNGPYTKGGLVTDTSAGSLFNKSRLVHGVKLYQATNVGGATAVPDLWTDKIARVVELFTDPTGSNIVAADQLQMIKTLRGDTGTWHAGKPTAQRIAYGGGASYNPNFLTEQGSYQYPGYVDGLLDEYSVNDMVWYRNSSSSRPGIGDDDLAEALEHIFHTLHYFGVRGGVSGSTVALSWDPSTDAQWATRALYAAIAEAVAATTFNISGYNDGNLATADTFVIAAKEYLYLLTFAMFEYTSLWDGGSLSPEWNDNARTPAGVQSNNPLGYALFNTYILPVMSKPTLATMRNIFQDGDTGNPAVAGASGYTADAAISLTGNFTISSNAATLDLNLSKDMTTEGSETLLLSLDSPLSATVSVAVTDSSILNPTYLVTSSAAAVNEGGTVTFTLTTTNVADATTVPYTITGVTSADLSAASLTGNFTVASNTATVTFTLAADGVTEGAETILLALDNTYDNHTVTINDTSIGADYTLNVGNNGASAYTLSGTDRSGSISGDDPALAFNAGDVVDFVVSAAGHPFYLKTVNGTGTGNQASGATNQGATNATIRWTVPAAGAYHYNCSLHAAMHGDITVS